MRRTILMVLLAIVSTSAVAEWVEFSHNENVTSYIDSANISKAGNKVKVWSLIDYSTANTNAGKTYLSVKAQHEFDCDEAQVRKLFTSLHSGNMGNGEVVGSSYRAGIMEPIQPGSILEVIWKNVCE